ncbi:MAG: VOC family protein [Porticoccaceae bacterium]|nr:VOC family protein [Porticoccaceae bacterium]MDG1307471.1 VOC family protein [Porticoccaceae bacterium]
MTISFDHLVIFVSNLEDAIGEFTDLGFTVTRGGSHGLTENALIIFANQTYIELLALKPFWHSPLMGIANRVGLLRWHSERKANIYCRLLRWVNGDTGPVDWCVRVSDLDSTLSRWRDAGLDVLKSEEFSRETLEGDVVRWQLAGATQPDLPILLEDITPIDLRVPLLGNTNHPNGAEGIKAIQYRAEDRVSAHNLATRILLPDHFKERTKRQDLELDNLLVQFAEHDMPYKASLIILYSGKQPKVLTLAKSYDTQIELTP